MEKFILKSEVTNDVNDDKVIEWVFVTSEEEKEGWIQAKKDEKIRWNLNTPGARSIRYLSIYEYSLAELLNENIEDLKGLRLEDLIKIIKYETNN